MENPCPVFPPQIKEKYIYIMLNLDIDDFNKKKENVAFCTKNKKGKYIKIPEHVLCFTTEFPKLYIYKITQEDINEMHKKKLKNNSSNYIPELFVQINGKLYYPYIISIDEEDITNTKEKLIYIFREYSINSLIGFHPFTKKDPLKVKILNKISILEEFIQEFENEIPDNYLYELLLSYYATNSVYNKKNFSFLVSTFYLNLLIKFKNSEEFKKILQNYKNFQWKRFGYLDEKKFFGIIDSLFLEKSNNEKEIMSKLDENDKNIIKRIYILYDIDNDYNLLKNEDYISSRFKTNEDKQKFYETYFDILFENNIYIKDFNYSKYLTDTNKIFEKYLKYELKDMSYTNFPFAMKDIYDTRESGCCIYKSYQTFDFSLRRSFQGTPIYLGNKIISMGTLFSPDPHPKVKEYLYYGNNKNKKIINDKSHYISSSYPLNNNQILVTYCYLSYPSYSYFYSDSSLSPRSSFSPSVIDLNYSKNNKNYKFEESKSEIFDAIVLKNKLIVGIGRNNIVYYCDSQNLNDYRIINNYQPENKNIKFIYLIEFNENLLVSCLVKDDEIKNKNINYFSKCYIGFHNFDNTTNNKNEIVEFDQINMKRNCLRERSVLAKLTDKIFCIIGKIELFFIEIDTKNIIKQINILSNGSYFSSIYSGDFNLLFICFKESRTITTFTEDFTVSSEYFRTYQLNEETLELTPVSRSYSDGKKTNCIIF